MRSTLEMAGTAILIGTALPAMAQEASDVEGEAPRGTVLAPKNAFEVGIDGGYNQPFGKIDSSSNVSDVAHAGGAIGLDLAWRATPIFGIGGFGEIHANAADSNLGPSGSVGGGAAGILASFHFLPYKVIDPYATVGGGYRGMWASPGTGAGHVFHGIEGARIRAGVDFRATKDIAVGPLVGADVNVFLADHNSATGITSDIASKSANTFIFAGLGARFDVGGRRVPEPGHAAPIPAAAPPIAREVQPATPTPPPEAPPSTGVSIDAEILAKCHLDNGKTFFEFDKSNLGACDLTTINEVAACFAGPLKGKKLEIIGYADPRGSDEYNLKLGESRAQSVEKYLEGVGMSSDAIVTSSKGKREASGVDENGWAFDRRVELRLKQ